MILEQDGVESLQSLSNDTPVIMECPSEVDGINSQTLEEMC